jgi:hypothetical protein
MTRIYRKTVEGIECLRWELEIKGRLARGLQEQDVLGDPHVRATFARAVLAGYPDALQHSLAMFADHIEQPTGELVRRRAEAEDAATLAWFRNTVVPALKKAMRGRLREDVVQLLREQNWALTKADELDRIELRRKRDEAAAERMYKNSQERTTTR